MKKYVDSHIVRQLTTGKGGAEVYLLDSHKIAKYAEKNKLLDKENGLAVWESCLKEAKFYKEMLAAPHVFLPEIFICDFDDESVLIIMGEYNQIDKQNLTVSDFDSIMKLIAQVHELAVPDFLKNEKQGPLQLTEEEIRAEIAKLEDKSMPSIMKHFKTNFAGKVIELINKDTNHSTLRYKAAQRYNNS